MSTATADASPPARILIVDDSRAIQAIVRRVIERIGYAALDVRTAGSGLDAIKLTETFRPQLIITDWHMPEMSGIEMLQALRYGADTDFRVGFITTESAPGMLNEARSNGAEFILHKPFNESELAEEITRVVPIDGTPPPPRRPVPAPQPQPQPQPQPPAGAADAAAAAAATAAESAPAPPLIDEAAIRQLVRSTMGDIPFRVLVHDGLAIAELSPLNLLGLYASGTRSVAAVAVMDTKAVCILGGGAARLMPSVVRSAMAAGQPSERMIELANTFLRNAATPMNLGPSDRAPSLSKSSLVPQGLQKLGDILSRSQRRVDYRVSVPGYGDGRFSFLAV